MAESSVFKNCAKQIIFLTGGVCSAVGKGVAISSVAAFLKGLGYKVRVKKCDPYLNIDPGTLSPFQHGEVFVTADGVETDLDIGHYERFTEQSSKQSDYITSGRVYWEILNRERDGGYQGKTVQVVPHVTDQIIKMILQDTEDTDILLCEIGGTVGDLEAGPYYESIRQIMRHINSKLIHVAYMPYVINEVKTKPVQHSVRDLLSLGLHPDIIVCRSNKKPEDNEWRVKIAANANIDQDCVILGDDVNNTYEMLCMYHKAGLLEAVRKILKIEQDKQVLEIVQQYEKLAEVARNSDKELNIAIVGKYITFEDSYKSLKEALFYSSTLAGAKLKLHWICAEDIYEDKKESWDIVKKADGIVVPGGFGERGANGMIKVVKYARENDIPFLGICFGMQMMAIEAAGNLCGYSNACSAEFRQDGDIVIDLIEKLLPANKDKLTSNITGVMRLGEYESQLNGVVKDIYEADLVKERFRHRYEVNKEFLPCFEKVGLHINGHTLIDGKYETRFIDSMSYPHLKFFIGVQYHPEFLTKPLTGHKLFNKFINACLNF